MLIKGALYDSNRNIKIRAYIAYRYTMGSDFMWPFRVNLIEEPSLVFEMGLGEVLLIAGPNGVGKSALVHEFYRQLGPNFSELFPGHRQIHFQSDDIDTIGQTFDALTHARYSNPHNSNRFRDAWGEAHLKSVVRRLVEIENQINRDAVSLIRSHHSNRSTNTVSSDQDSQFVTQALKDIEDNPSIIDTLNSIFGVARLEVRLVLVDGILRAAKAGNIFGLERLSDGERAALLLVAAILVRPSGTIIMIDEPEKHLNPAIFSGLIAASVRDRPDIGFIFSSHDLSLVEWLSPKNILTVKDSKISFLNADGTEVRRYDAYLIKPEDGISEELKRSILGARKSVLFVEGKDGSDDALLYGLLYQDRSIVSKGSWESVSNSVRVLKDNPAYHWMSVSGIIDNDGRQEAEVNALAADHIHSLKTPTIENLFFLPEVCRLMSEAAHEFFGGDSPEDRFNAADSQVSDLVKRHREDILHRRVVWILNRMLSERKVSVRSVASGQKSIERINICLVLEQERRSLNEISQGSGLSILEMLPIKNTIIPNQLSIAMGFDNFSKYKSAVCQQIDKGHSTGQKIADEMRRRVGI